MSTTKYIVNNLSGQTITNESILRPYKVYSALLTQSGNGTSTQTTGPLIIGARYIITTYISDDDFTSVANVISGTVNTDNCEFIAIGTTPDNYLNGSTLTDTGAPVATVLENTLGVVPTYTYDNTGTFILDTQTNNPNCFIIIGQVGQAYLTSYTLIYNGVYELTTGNIGGAYAPSNDVLIQTSIEIRVYN